MKALKSEQKKVIFVTFNRLGYECLRAVLESGLAAVKQVYTLSPEFAKNISDYMDITPLCREYNIPLKRVKNINSELEEIKSLKPDLICVLGWSQILKKELLKLPSIGCVGFHPALLPRNRGRAAIPWHFINNEKFGGATLFFMNEGADSGDILGQIRFPLSERDNAKSYYEKAVAAGVKILRDRLPGLINGNLKPKKQDHRLATYLLIRRPEDSFLDFRAMNSRQIFNQVRAVAHIYPSAFVFFGGRRAEVLAASKVPKKYHIYSARPGQIIKVFFASVWVKTFDGIIELREILIGGKKLADCRKVFKPGQYFNR